VSFLVPAITKSTSVLPVAFLIAASPMTGAIEPDESADRAAIEAFTRKFLRAFEDLDMRQFIACFADEATMFFPMPEPPERAEGKQAIQKRFEQVFASIRRTAKSGPPFHHLAPEDLAIQIMPGQERRCLIPPQKFRADRASNARTYQHERAMAHPPSARLQRSNRGEIRSLGGNHFSKDNH